MSAPRYVPIEHADITVGDEAAIKRMQANIAALRDLLPECRLSLILSGATDAEHDLFARIVAAIGDDK